MGPQLTVNHDFKVEGRRSDDSPRHNGTGAVRRTTAGSAPLSLFRRSGSRRSTIQLLFVVIASLALLSTIILQFMASEHRQSFRRSGEDDPHDPMMAGHHDIPYGSGENGGGRGDESIEHPVPVPADFYEDSGIGEGVDRRFRGQKTGRPPKTLEELSRPPPSAGPFGWGTDWAVGVSVLVETVGEEGAQEEDVINPPWCAAPENRSFVEFVYARRSYVDPYDRVRVVTIARTDSRRCRWRVVLGSRTTARCARK